MPNNNKYIYCVILINYIYYYSQNISNIYYFKHLNIVLLCIINSSMHVK